MSLRQCAILVGGAGTRLGALTQDTPKPMLSVAGKPFLEHLITKAAHHGLDHILLLAGHQSQVVTRWLSDSAIAARLGLEISLSVEPQPLGTGGAVAHARDQLEDAFLLINGDTWFDFDWPALARTDRHPATLALRQIDQADRYETVELSGDRVTRLAPRSGLPGPGLINGGVYRLTKAAISRAAGAFSLETDLLPILCAAGHLGGGIFEGAFIDIGVPESYAAAQGLLSARS